MTDRKGAVALALALLLLLGGCGESKAAPESEAGAAPTPEAAAAPDAALETGRADGERFEESILVEGMEETVLCEHVRCERLGFALDYDCERFARKSEAGAERFVSVYDLPDAPENYLELYLSAEDAEAAADTLGAELSARYELIRESCELGGAGSCIRLDASQAKGSGGTPDQLQSVYIIPAPDGSLIAAAHFGFESAEGFGRRFRAMAESLTLLERRPESGLTGTWQTASITIAPDGTMAPEHTVRFTETEIVYGYLRDGVFVAERADPILAADRSAEGVTLRSESPDGVRYSFRSSESDSGVLEYFETWEESAFPEAYRGGASLWRVE